MKNRTKQKGSLVGYFKELFQLTLAQLVFVFSFTFIVYLFWLNFDWGLSTSDNLWFTYSNRFFSDLFAFLGVATLFFSKKRLGSFVFYFLVFVLAFVYFIQSVSFSEAGHFLPSIALENARHADFLSVGNIVLQGLVWLVGFILVGYVFYRLTPSKPKVSARVVTAIFLITCAVLIQNDGWLIGEQARETRVNFFAQDTLINHNSAVSELIATLSEYKQYIESGTEIPPTVALMANNDARDFHKSQFGEFPGEHNANFPYFGS